VTKARNWQPDAKKRKKEGGNAIEETVAGPACIHTKERGNEKRKQVKSSAPRGEKP